jgi:hypothetical protein
MLGTVWPQREQVMMMIGFEQVDAPDRMRRAIYLFNLFFTMFEFVPPAASMTPTPKK